MTDEVMLVITGAGASYDCVDEVTGRDRGLLRPGTDVTGLDAHYFDDARPPLTKELVENRDLYNGFLQKYRDAIPVASQLRRRLAVESEDPVTIESALREYQDASPGDDVRRRHLVAFRFYLRDVLWAVTHYMNSATLTGGDTHYVRLVNDLRVWALKTGASLCFVNFNYDLLLEEAITRACGFVPELPPIIGGEGRIRLIKPHGSVNWAWQIGESDDNWYGRQAADRVAIERGLDPPDDARLVLRRSPFDVEEQRRLTVAIPALALPMDGGSKLMLGGADLEYLEGLRGRVRRVLVIGWRGGEPEFNDLLRGVVRDDANAQIVCGGSGEEARSSAENLMHNVLGLTDRPELLRGYELNGFTAFDQSDRLGWLLHKQ